MGRKQVPFTSLCMNSVTRGLELRLSDQRSLGSNGTSYLRIKEMSFFEIIIFAGTTLSTPNLRLA